MDMRTGEIKSEEEVKKLEQELQKRFTALSENEEKVLRPMNRHERRARLVQMRRALVAKAKEAQAKKASGS
jgi:hypothetical protein